MTSSRGKADASDPPRGYSVFEFNMLDPLVDQLTAHLETVLFEPLTEASVNDLVKDLPGIYLLLLDEKVVYVGKADSRQGLKSRLSRHAFHIRDREHLSSQNLSFKAAHVPTFTAMDIEARLIKFYDPDWNGSGFGNNDPGRNRDNTIHKLDGFDRSYPINIDRPDNYVPLGEYSVSQLLKALANKLPYTLRYTKLPGDKEAFDNCNVTIGSGPLSVRDLLVLVFDQLPTGYQAWKLPGRIIIYEEVKDYLAGELIVRS